MLPLASQTKQNWLTQAIYGTVKDDWNCEERDAWKLELKNNMRVIQESGTTNLGYISFPPYVSGCTGTASQYGQCQNNPKWADSSFNGIDLEYAKATMTEANYDAYLAQAPQAHARFWTAWGSDELESGWGAVQIEVDMYAETEDSKSIYFGLDDGVAGGRYLPQKYTVPTAGEWHTAKFDFRMSAGEHVFKIVANKYNFRVRNVKRGTTDPTFNNDICFIIPYSS